MELTYDQMDFICTAIVAHMSALRRDMVSVNDPLVTETIQVRIDNMLPVMEALASGNYTLTLEEY